MWTSEIFPWITSFSPTITELSPTPLDFIIWFHLYDIIRSVINGLLLFKPCKKLLESVFFFRWCTFAPAALITWFSETVCIMQSVLRLKCVFRKLSLFWFIFDFNELYWIRIHCERVLTKKYFPYKPFSILTHFARPLAGHINEPVDSSRHAFHRKRARRCGCYYPRNQMNPSWDPNLHVSFANCVYPTSSSSDSSLFLTLPQQP